MGRRPEYHGSIAIDCRACGEHQELWVASEIGRRFGLTEATAFHLRRVLEGTPAAVRVSRFLFVRPAALDTLIPCALESVALREEWATRGLTLPGLLSQHDLSALLGVKSGVVQKWLEAPVAKTWRARINTRAIRISLAALERVIPRILESVHLRVLHGLPALYSAVAAARLVNVRVCTLWRACRDKRIESASMGHHRRRFVTLAALAERFPLVLQPSESVEDADDDDVRTV